MKKAIRPAQLQARRGKLRYMLKLLISASLLILLFARMDLGAIGRALTSIRLEWFSLAAAMTFGSMSIAAMRWKVLLPEIPYLRLARYSLIGQFYSVVLPGQIAGDAVKAWKMSEGTPEPMKVLASVLVDRVIGLIALLIVATLGAAFSSSAVARTLWVPLLLLTAALAAMPYVLTASFIWRPAGRLIAKSGAVRPHIDAISEKLALMLRAWDGFAREPMRIAATFFLGIIYQLLAVAICFALAQGMNIEIDIQEWMWITGLAAIVVLLPVTIGGLGLREGTLVGALLYFDIPAEKSLMLSLQLFMLLVLLAIAGWIADSTEPQHAVSGS